MSESFSDAKAIGEKLPNIPHLFYLVELCGLLAIYQP